MRLILHPKVYTDIDKIMTMGTLVTSWTNPARIIDPLKLCELSPRSQQRYISLNTQGL